MIEVSQRAGVRGGCAWWAAALLVSVLAVEPARATVRVGQPFPSFTAQDALTDEPFTLEDFRGKAVVVDFWATWCGPCRRELPNVKQAYEKFRDEGLEIISISIDSSEARFRTFVEKSGMDWYHVMEGGGWKTRLATDYRISSIPRMFVLDRNGICVADRARGHTLEAAIKRALATTADAVARKADLDPASARLLAQLKASRSELEATMAPVQRLADRLDAISSVLTRLARPAGAQQTAGARTARMAYVHRELGRIRHELFMLGVLDDERTVVLPAGPTAVLAEAGPEAAGRISRAVAVAMVAVGDMQSACAVAREQLAWLNNRIRRLERAVVAGSASAEALQWQVGEVRDHALVLAETWCEPWLEQVVRTERMIAGIGRPLAELLDELDGIEQRIAILRTQLDTAGATTPASGASGAAIDAVSGEVTAAVGQLARLGLEVSPAAAASDAAGRLAAAAETVGRARAAILDERRRVERLAREAVAIRSELAEHLQSGSDLAELRARFSDLAREALASQDRSG